MSSLLMSPKNPLTNTVLVTQCPPRWGCTPHLSFDNKFQLLQVSFDGENESQSARRMPSLRRLKGALNLKDSSSLYRRTHAFKHLESQETGLRESLLMGTLNPETEITQVTFLGIGDRDSTLTGEHSLR